MTCGALLCSVELDIIPRGCCHCKAECAWRQVCPSQSSSTSPSLTFSQLPWDPSSLWDPLFSWSWWSRSQRTLSCRESFMMWQTTADEPVRHQSVWHLWCAADCCLVNWLKQYFNFFQLFKLFFGISYSRLGVLNWRVYFFLPVLFRDVRKHQYIPKS